MIIKMFSIFDAKAKAYITPFFMPTAGMAVRTFSDMINDNTCAFSKHPEDYTLFNLGSLDDSTALITLEQTPMVMHNGITLVTQPEDDNEIQHGTPILSSTESGNSTLKL